MHITLWRRVSHKIISHDGFVFDHHPDPPIRLAQLKKIDRPFDKADTELIKKLYDSLSISDKTKIIHLITRISDNKKLDDKKCQPRVMAYSILVEGPELTIEPLFNPNIRHFVNRTVDTYNEIHFDRYFQFGKTFEQRLEDNDVLYFQELDYMFQAPHEIHHGKSGQKPPKGHLGDDLTYAQFVFVCYTMVAHTFAFLFPIRLCWSVQGMTKRLQSVSQKRKNSLELKSVPQLKKSHADYSDDETFSSYYTETDSEEGYAPIVHAIILPNYKEDLDTLRETLDVLACHALASSSYDIYLAMELGEEGAAVKASILVKEFSDKFRCIEYTLHPRGIPGEAQGKSSNLRWAGRYLVGKYGNDLNKRNIIVTVIDADSHLAANYFTLINGMHLSYPETSETTIYVPPIIFDRNAHVVPQIVRVADIVWAGAGLSNHYHGSSICPPTSVYSLPLSIVDRVCGWDAGDDAIGEDLHMYLKCFFALNGNLTARTILSAASQSNVSSNIHGIRGFFADCRARYRQALRHMWGALDSGYFTRSLARMWWRTRCHTTGDRPHWLNTLGLLQCMYEAHFLPTHIFFIIITSAVYTVITPTSSIPPTLLLALDLTGYMRLCSFLIFSTFFYLYESFHYTCVKDREEAMICAGIADRMLGTFTYRSFWKNGLDFLMFPVVGVVFGSVPSIIAQVNQFWTLSLVYTVSKKPQRVVAP
ncbi:hypothetical protein B7494_g5022 [Chlorociboria aeruginascens]|nr:hypothetical protein B7494_g5022 [Chlorociboria aeruginascens]